MIFIIDTNILISALIRDSTTRKIIVESEWEFYYPEESFHEVRKYKELILKKSGLSQQEYSRLLNYLLTHITLVPIEQIKEKLNKANECLGKIDADDVIFLATALSLDNSKIWSDDKHFEKVNIVGVFKTKDMMKLFLSSS